MSILSVSITKTNMFVWFVQYICDKLMQRPDRSTYSSVPVDKQVLLTIWTLANPEAFRSIGDRFGFANRGMAHYCFMSTCRRITDTLYSDSVLWPSTVDCRRNADEFEKQYGFPGVVGCIDGCHIPIKAPVTDRDSYVNRKGFTSVNFLGVCDHRMKFIYAYTDCPGSVHDAHVLDVSSLKQKLSEDSGFNVEHYHLLGDAAYPLLPGLMVPVRDNGHLTQAQVRYNALHSAARAVVERCFGRLKGKFRRLKSLDVTRTDYSSVIIETCIVLHNICLDDEFDESSSVDDVADDDVECDSTDQSAPADHRRADKAKLKRDRIMNAL